MRVSILTRSLTRGGAQVQVVALANGLARRGHSASVVVFYGGGALTGSVRGARIVDLEKSTRWQLLRPFWRLLSHLRNSEAEIVYSFLPLENLFGLVCARLARKPIVWGVRGAAVKRGQYGFASRLLYGLQFRLVRYVDAVICNSQAAAAEISEPPGRQHLYVIPNGIDCDKFDPSPQQRDRWRAEHAIAPDAILIGIVARLDPMKDHANFLRAAASVAKRLPHAAFVIAGSGPLRYAQEMQDLAKQLGLSERIYWLGEVPEPVEVYRALDLLVSSSAYGEGSSNALGEAMACGLAPVATDVGDSARVVGRHGRIVPAQSPERLAEAAIQMQAEDTPAARRARREWIVENFGIDAMVSRTEDVLRQVADRRSQGHSAGAQQRTRKP